jgi:hypothetical protein
MEPLLTVLALISLDAAPPPAAPAPLPPPLPVEVSVYVDFDLKTGADVVLAGFAAHWDGVPLREGDRRQQRTTGAHEVAVQLDFESLKPGAKEPPVHVKVKQMVVLPRALGGQKGIQGQVIVHVIDSGGDGPLATRLSATSEAKPFGAWKPWADEIVMLAPNTGARQRISDVQQPPHRPIIPSSIRDRVGKVAWGLYKVCVDATGVVHAVTTMRPAQDVGPLDPLWRATIRTWRYRPYQIDGRPVAFCTPVRVQVTDD